MAPTVSAVRCQPGSRFARKPRWSFQLCEQRFRRIEHGSRPRTWWGFNGLGGPSIGGFCAEHARRQRTHLAAMGALTPAAVMSGWSSQSAPLSSGYPQDHNSSLEDLIPQTSINGDAHPWQQQQNGAAPRSPAKRADEVQYAAARQRILLERVDQLLRGSTSSGSPTGREPSAAAGGTAELRPGLLADAHRQDCHIATVAKLYHHGGRHRCQKHRPCGCEM